jgi:hypothetical protein
VEADAHGRILPAGGARCGPSRGPSASRRAGRGLGPQARGERNERARRPRRADGKDLGRLCHANGAHGRGERRRKDASVGLYEATGRVKWSCRSLCWFSSSLLSHGVVDSGLARFRQPCIRARQGRGALAGA